MGAALQSGDIVDTISTITDALGNLLYLIRSDANNPTAVLAYLDCADERVAALNRFMRTVESPNGLSQNPPG